MIKELSINGFRGFGEIQTIVFSLPDGEHEGSGLNIITGANNSGKTTIIESIKLENKDYMTQTIQEINSYFNSGV